MNFSNFVRARLATLGYGQRDLARAAQVTDSYISQLLTRKKAPPARDRTDIYAKMETFLRLDPGQLGRLADSDRSQEVMRRLGQAPEPLFQSFRDLVLRKCDVRRRDEVRRAFEAQPFGTLERLVAQTLLGVVQRVARRELDSEEWLNLAARVGGRSQEEMRVIVLEFLDTDEFHVSNENCVAFIDPLVDSWDIDLDNLSLQIVLNRSLVPDPHRTFTFVERVSTGDLDDAGAGLAAFLEDPRMSQDVTEEELRVLQQQRFTGRRPTKLYYYRALQILRDPLHFDD